MSFSCSLLSVNMELLVVQYMLEVYFGPRIPYQETCWISKHALHLFARGMPHAFIRKLWVKNNNCTSSFVLPGWVNGGLLRVVQHQAC